MTAITSKLGLSGLNAHDDLIIMGKRPTAQIIAWDVLWPGLCARLKGL